MRFTEEMFKDIIPQLTGGMTVQVPDRDGTLVDVDFTPPWPRLTLQEAILEKSGIDIHAGDSAGALREAMKSKKIRLDVPVETLGFGNLVDQLYKKVVRPELVQP